ncbi:Dicer-like protein 1 [Tilletia horrida]|nr:Dicer-like protein 1 [Tilletia horrida]
MSVPRLYQQQLFERAKVENVIACADTGTGKTLVAVMLLKWTLEEEVKRCKADPSLSKRISVMVVHHVPLVHQQGDYINNNSNLKVQKLYGELNIDKWDEDQWSKLLAESDVIVCTAQILKDALAHGFVSFDDLNLLIFDEVHHAVKDDVYARIMTSHYQTHTGTRPKIFGMTASPISTSKPNFKNAAEELEACMDSKIFTVPVEGWMSLSEATFKAKTEIVLFDPPDVPYLSDFASSVLQVLQANDKQPALIKTLERLGPALGPHLSDWILDSALQEAMVDISAYQHLRGLSAEERAELAQNWNVPMQKARSPEDKIKKLKKKCAEHQELEQVVRHQRLLYPDADPRVSTKVEALVSLLERIFGVQAERRGIIFAKEKATVHALLRYLRTAMPLGSIMIDALVGHTGAYGQTWKEQEQVLSKFRRGETQLLIATRVVEEGLDVPACNFVVRFDLPETAIQTIQSRGRAREKDSTMYMLCQSGKIEDVELLEKCDRLEAGMKAWLQSLTEDRMANLAGEDDDDEEKKHSVFVPRWTRKLESITTGAVIEPRDAMSLLNRYVQSLPKDQFTPSKVLINVEEDGEEDVSVVPNIEPLFRCTLKMPARCKLREARSEWQPSKKAARQEAAFIACEKLFEMEELDDRLLPRRPVKINPDVLALVDEEGRVKEFRRTEFPRPTAHVFRANPDKSNTFWSTVIPFNTLGQEALQGDVASMLLITSIQPAPATVSLELGLFDGRAQLSCTPGDAGPITMTEEETALAQLYTARLFNMIARRQLVNKISSGAWMVLPVQPGSDGASIDWEEVTKLASADSTAFQLITDADKLDSNTVVTESADLIARPFALRSVRHDLQPSSLAPAGTRQAKLGETFQQFYERISRVQIADEGPVLEVKKLPRMQNFTKVSESRAHTTEPSFLLPAIAFVHPVSARVYRAAILLPSFLSRLNAVILAQESREEVLQSVPVSDQALIMALTAPAAAVGFSYQKFEFLGDSILKLVATCHAFVSDLEADEGQLTLDRDRLVSNRVLAGHAMRMQLWRYVCLDAFTRKTWVPPGYPTVEEGSAGGKEPMVSWSAKRLADIVEALLGSIVADTIDQKLKVAQQLGLLPPEITSFAGFGAVYDQAITDVMPEMPFVTTGLAVDRLSETIHYTFKRPELALNAITHSSVMGSDLPSYERLEVLGDALLDYFVVNKLHHKYDSFAEGELTIVKANCVNNQTLAALAISLQLHKHLIHDSRPLTAAITAYAADVKATHEAEMAQRPESPQQYWWDLSAPKTCADIVESLLGAVLVDSSFDFDTASNFFDENYWPFFERFCRPENAILSSAGDLFELLLQRRCQHWKISKIGGNEDEIMTDAIQSGNEIEAEESTTLDSTIRVTVHGTTCGEVRRKDSEFLDQMTAAMASLDLWRTGAPDAPAQSELLDTLKEMWPMPLRTKKMCMPRLVLESLCSCSVIASPDED